jgi:hypothetical protein
VDRAAILSNHESPIRVMVTEHECKQEDELPKVSPPSAEEEAEHERIPRLWAPGGTPRGLKERQLRQQHEQLQLMGFSQGSVQTALEGAGGAPASRQSSANVAGAHQLMTSASQSSVVALTPARMTYQVMGSSGGRFSQKGSLFLSLSL